MKYTAKQIDNFRMAKRYVAYCAGKILVSGIESMTEKEMLTAERIAKTIPRKVYNSDIKEFMRIIKK